jgi:hypothetical protein
MTDLMHCIYASAAAHDFTAAQLADLLQVARNNNDRLGVTGILLYVEGNFFQVLEGSPAAVTQIYKTIGEDTRHLRMTQIISESLPRRDFTEWSMGFLSLSQEQLAEIVGAKDFFDWNQSLQPMLNGRARKLLEAFCEGCWRAAVPGAGQLLVESA